MEGKFEGKVELYQCAGSEDLYLAHRNPLSSLVIGVRTRHEIICVYSYRRLQCVRYDGMKQDGSTLPGREQFPVALRKPTSTCTHLDDDKLNYDVYALIYRWLSGL